LVLWRFGVEVIKLSMKKELRERSVAAALYE